MANQASKGRQMTFLSSRSKMVQQGSMGKRRHNARRPTCQGSLSASRSTPCLFYLTLWSERLASVKPYLPVVSTQLEATSRIRGQWGTEARVLLPVPSLLDCFYSDCIPPPKALDLAEMPFLSAAVTALSRFWSLLPFHPVGSNYSQGWLELDWGWFIIPLSLKYIWKESLL